MTTAVARAIRDDSKSNEKRAALLLQSRPDTVPRAEGAKYKSQGQARSEARRPW